MSGVKIEIELSGLDRVNEMLNRIISNGNDLSPAMRQIGEHIQESTQDRFLSMISPDGSPWEPLSDTTLSLKKRKDRILTEEGILSGSINYQHSADSVIIGTPLEYGAIHQLGGTTSASSMMPNKDIPARPFLGISESDEDAIVDILKEHLSDI